MKNKKTKPITDMPGQLEPGVIRRYGIFIYFSLEDNAFIAISPELKGCMADGQTYEEALTNILSVIPEWLKVAAEAGWDVPKATGVSAFRAL